MEEQASVVDPAGKGQNYAACIAKSKAFKDKLDGYSKK